MTSCLSNRIILYKIRHFLVCLLQCLFLSLSYFSLHYYFFLSKNWVRTWTNYFFMLKYIYLISAFLQNLNKMQVRVYSMREVVEVHKWCVNHSMTSLAATVVTSCRGISALARMSWALLEPCWMLVRMRVVPPAVVMILSEDPADSIEATTALPEFTPFLFWWVLMCFARWSLRMKRLEHSGQTNFFSPATDKIQFGR